MLTNKIYSSEVLDTQYDKLLKERLDYLKNKYSEEELQLISFNDLSLMGAFLSTVKPVSHTRKHKKTLLKYADIYVELNKKKLNNKRFIYENSNIYLAKVSKYLEKFGFTYKGIWNIYVFILIFIEILIIIFFKKTSYILPVILILMVYRIKQSEKKALREGKLLRL